jgi:carbon-monoxide dehydrogenase medium subunit
MKPAPFAYHQARSTEEAISLLGEFGDEGKVLAGGQSLVPAMNFRLSRPAVLIDINNAEDLDFIAAGKEGLRIGSLVRHVALERTDLQGPQVSLLRSAAPHIGHLPIRVRGTFGGSLAHADPAAEWCVIASLLEGQVVVRNTAGTRSIPASDFFVTTFTTSLGPDELVVETLLPPVSETTKFGFTEFSRRAGDFALAMVAVAIDVLDGRIIDARIACGGVSDRPVRLPAAESVLRGEQLSQGMLESAAEVAAEDFEAVGDIHGSAEYRRTLVRVLTRRVLEQVTEA